MRAGITTYADTCDSGVVMQAMREAGVRGIMYQEVFGPDPAQCDESIAGLREKVAGLRYLETPLVRLGDFAARAVHRLRRPLSRRRRARARASDFPMAIHIAESELERALVVDARGCVRRRTAPARHRGVARAPSRRSSCSQSSACSTRAAADPLRSRRRARRRDDRRRPARAVAHCPASNAKLGHGIAPLDELLAAGVRRGARLATRWRATIAWTCSRRRASRCSRSARASDRGRRRPRARRARDGDDRRSARARARARSIGTLEPGKQADLAAFALDRAGPTLDPVTAAVFSSPARARGSSPSPDACLFVTACSSRRALVWPTACRHWRMRSLRGCRRAAK